MKAWYVQDCFLAGHIDIFISDTEDQSASPLYLPARRLLLIYSPRSINILILFLANKQKKALPVSSRYWTIPLEVMRCDVHIK